MHFYAYHGYFESERTAGTDFLVDVTLKTDCKPAAESDNLDYALNYQVVFTIVKNEMQVKSQFYLHGWQWQVPAR